MTAKPTQPAATTTPVIPSEPEEELEKEEEDGEETTSVQAKNPEEYHAPVYGDTVYVVDGNEKNVKAQVLDPTFREGPNGKGIKVMVVPASSQPFPTVVAYDANGGQNTWHWKEIVDDA